MSQRNLNLLFHDAWIARKWKLKELRTSVVNNYTGFQSNAVNHREKHLKCLSNQTCYLINCEKQNLQANKTVRQWIDAYFSLWHYTLAGRKLEFCMLCALRNLPLANTLQISISAKTTIVYYVVGKQTSEFTIIIPSPSRSTCFYHF